MGNLLRNFKEMIATPDFFLGLLIVGLSYGMIFLFNLSAPFIIEHQMGYTPVTVGYASLIMGIAWMLGGFLGRTLMNKPFLPKIQLASLVQTTLILAMYIFLSGFKTFTLCLDLPFLFIWRLDLLLTITLHIV
jgi:predicted MFS family arabinose efflux permease